MIDAMVGEALDPDPGGAKAAGRLLRRRALESGRSSLVPRLLTRRYQANLGD